MRVLVSGGTGFVGRAVVRRFAAAGYEVSVLNRGRAPAIEARQLTADRNNPAAVSSMLRGERFDLVVDTNCYTPAQAEILIAALEGDPRLGMVSSAAVYADHAARPSGEDEPLGGASVWGDYGREKTEAEGVYASAASRFRACVAVRPPYIFGPENSLDRETWFWARQLRGLPILLPGGGQTQAQFVHVDDVAEALFVLLQDAWPGFQAFNVTDPTSPTFSELATLLARAAGGADLQVAVGEAAGELFARSWFPFRDTALLVDPGKLFAASDWRPAGGLADRFAETFPALPPGRLALDALTPVEKTLLRRL